MDLVRSDLTNLLKAGMKKEFFKAFESEETAYKAIVTETSSDKNQEVYPFLGSSPTISEWKDERKPVGMTEYSKTIVNYDWEGSLGVETNAIDDEQYGQIKLRVQDLGGQFARFYDELVFSLVRMGNSTSATAGTILEGKSITAYDGKAMFANDHSEGDSGTIDNYGTTAFGSNELKAIITAMMKFKNDKGRYAGITPNLLAVSPDVKWDAMEKLNSVYYPEEGTTTSKMSNNVLKGALDLIVSPWLTDTNDYFVFDTTKAIKPIILQTRKTPEFTALDTGTESLFMRKRIFYGVDARIGIGWSNYRLGYGEFVA